jgi:hypothetical protein
MPYEYTIDPVARRVHVRGFGASSFEEARLKTEELAGNPAYDPSFAILFDGRELEYLASYEDALQFRDMFGRLRASFRGPLAIVVQGTARYGVSRMIATLADLVGVRMEAFLAMPDAEAWLLQQSAGS